MEDIEYVDNRNQDPDFEPQKKKQKKSSNLISNELLLYAITKFGKAFYTEIDRVERKLMCEMIRDDLITEKNTVIEPDIIYDNLMKQKRTFLREKKKNPQKVKWPFYELFVSLGDCIRSEHSTSEKKHNSSKSHHSKSKKSPSRKDSKKSIKDDLMISSTSTGLKDLYGGSFTESDTGRIEQEDEDMEKKSNNNDSIINVATKDIIDGLAKQDEIKDNQISSPMPSTSSNFKALESTPKSVQSRPKGFLFDNSVDIRNKVDYFFGKYDTDESLNKADDDVPEQKDPQDFKDDREMNEFLGTLISQTPDEDEEKGELASQFPAPQAFPVTATQALPVTATQALPFTATQALPVTAIQAFPDTATQALPVTATQALPVTATQALPVTATQAFPDTAIQAFPVTQQANDGNNNSTMIFNSNNNDNDVNKDKINDKNGPEKMITDDDKPPIIDDSREKTMNNIMNEVFANKSFKEIDDAANSEKIKELKKLFQENESRVVAMLEMEEKLFKMQQAMIQSELKFKAKLVEILEIMHK